MNKNLLKVMRVDINKALEAVGEKHGCTLELGSIRYSEDSFEGKLSCTMNAADGSKVSKNALLWNTSCHLFGFEKEDLGREFTVRGKTFTISGLKPSNRKYPILADQGGGTYKFNDEDVLRYLERSKPKAGLTLTEPPAPKRKPGLTEL